MAESDEVSLRPFDEPEGAERMRTTVVRPSESRWKVSRDLVDYSSALEVRKGAGVVRFPDIDLDVTRDTHESYRWVADDFTSAEGETVWTMGFRRGDWNVRTVTRTVRQGDPERRAGRGELHHHRPGRRRAAARLHAG